MMKGLTQYNIYYMILVKIFEFYYLRKQLTMLCSNKHCVYLTVYEYLLDNYHTLYLCVCPYDCSNKHSKLERARTLELAYKLTQNRYLNKQYSINTVVKAK